MRPADRIPRIIRKLELLWVSNPDMRLGQMIRNLAAFYRSDLTPNSAILTGEQALVTVEDDIMERWIEKARENWCPPLFMSRPGESMSNEEIKEYLKDAGVAMPENDEDDV